MADVYHDRVRETGTGTSGTITLAGAVAQYQSFSVVGNGNTCRYTVVDADNVKWGTFGGVWSTGGSLSRVTTYESSNGVGSAVTFSGGTHQVFLTPDSTQFPTVGGTSAISGLSLIYVTGTQLGIGEGTAVVNGAHVSFSTTVYTSASTMKNIANATVTLAASSAYWVFISSGGVIGIEVNDGTGDGAVPVFDTALDYWKAASTGAAWRRIGKFWTNGSSQIYQFRASYLGRIRRFFIAKSDDVLLVSGTVNSSYTAITLTPYYTGDESEMLIGATATFDAVTGNNSGGVGLSVDAATDITIDVLAIAVPSNAPGWQFGVIPAHWLPYVSSLYYRSYGGSAAYITASGFSLFI